MKNIFKKIYYKKYSKTSYSISGVDLIIDRMFSKVKKGIYIDPDTYVNRNIKPLIDYPLSNKLLATVEYSGMSKKTFSNPGDIFGFP